MAQTKLIDRSEPAVFSRTHTPVRSRLPATLRVPILVALNLGINTALWSFVSNFLSPELGAVSKVPNEADLWSLYSPGARLGMRVFTIWLTWYLNYDFYDVSALTILSNAPFAYLLSTFYDISTLTIAAHVNIEVFSIAIPTYLLRRRSAAHDANAKLRNRFLLNSVQVQFSNALLAMGVYIVVLWAGLRTGFLNLFLVRFFDIPTLEFAHIETPVSIIGKIFTAGFAAKEFLLNPSFAAQPLHSGTTTPTKLFDPSTATLTQTVKKNVWSFTRRTRTLIQQTAILNAFVFANTVQRCMTLNGTEVIGAAGYASVWVLANAVIALWYGWVGDTSADYEPL
ncbi:uncharacterized protein K460DRAFT_140751 [Cucurbitaria berberidis CBS 394.84]|uniref:Uncharacterized protein n=1 Tax=Cucurbitaria berberidis CBS 394.84 TaxID=1168544 RepID=A0A9P4GD79_9PLEO|nr:uncharacterized protein K460DRAFT_140751 [Cucurbitaria berberidis CBS 394.84]KAF1843191.1 hypothetical protein K460DRAFT_140751 [Cucurbitaria berberidis CBS 394.84]